MKQPMYDNEQLILYYIMFIKSVNLKKCYVNLLNPYDKKVI